MARTSSIVCQCVGGGTSVVVGVMWLMLATPWVAADVSVREGQPRARDRQWLLDYVKQPIAGTARNARYLRLIDRNLDDGYLGVDTAWFENGDRRRFLSREQTNALGRLAFCYRTPGLRYHKDVAALDLIRQAYRGVVANVSPEGKFTWEPKLNSWGYEGQEHEHAWRLEPLLLGYLWVGEQLPPDERKEIEAALRRAADWLNDHPLTQTNNRGAVWCAVLTLCGLAFDEPRYTATVERHADQIIRGVVQPDGEVGEHTRQYGGGGPCSNYTYTGWAYIHLYWRLSGRRDLDPLMLQATRWLAQYSTMSGHPRVTGASVRRAYAMPVGFQNVLVSYEHFSHKEPFFATLAELALARQERHTPIFRGHIVSPLIWAMLESGTDAPGAAGDPPAWYTKHAASYMHPEVQYTLLTRQYQTGVVSRGRTRKGYNFPLRGLQSFAVGREPPVLMHSDEARSSTAAGGIDTSTTDVDRSGEDWEAVLSEGELVRPSDAALATLVERRGDLWTLYAFSPASCVVVYGGVDGPLTSRWVINRQIAPEPSLHAADRRVSFHGLQGAIIYLEGEATLENAPPANPDQAPVAVLQVIAPAAPSAFGFGDAALRFDGVDSNGRRLMFADGSGRYQIDLTDIVTGEGTLNRGSGCRLKPLR